MNKRVVFRHMDHSNTLENHLNEQLKKLETFLVNEPTPVNLDVVLEADARRSMSRGELLLKSPHYDFIVHAQQPDMYDVIDEIVDKAYKLIHEKKKQRIGDRKT